MEPRGEVIFHARIRCCLLATETFDAIRSACSLRSRAGKHLTARRAVADVVPVESVSNLGYHVQACPEFRGWSLTRRCYGRPGCLTRHQS
jgi:hypothetical protein